MQDTIHPHPRWLVLISLSVMAMLLPVVEQIAGTVAVIVYKLVDKYF